MIEDFNKFREAGIGDIIEYKGTLLMCVQSPGDCGGHRCFFDNYTYPGDCKFPCGQGYASGYCRRDNNNPPGVAFVPVDDVIGEIK